MIEHQDLLDALNKDIPLPEKLSYMHGVLRERFDVIERVAVAIYDPKTDVLSSYLDSSRDDRRVEHYHVELEQADTLRDMVKEGRPRILSSLDIFSDSNPAHMRRASDAGYRASYVMPMFMNGNFFGFVFFISDQEDPFSSELLHYLDLFGHLISLIVINEVSAIHTLLAAIKTARDVTHHRDIETGAHLDRMALYAQLIARELADDHGFDDDYIEHVFLFAPLHDIGKIGVPDSILLKPGKLTKEEYGEMKTHVVKGRQIIDEMLSNFGLESFQRIDVLRNIAQFHHEAVDGSGYPYGLSGDEIPIEARIVSVADVFDALTSRRPYKEPWANEDAFAAMYQLSGVTLDPSCVQALHRRQSEVEKIQARFQEDQYG